MEFDTNQALTWEGGSYVPPKLTLAPPP